MVTCVLCQRSQETRVTGALSTKDGTTAHQNCLLYSSGLFCRNTPEFDDLFGFSVEDVNDEVNRGNKLTCHKCKKRGATAGCEVRRCKKSYHYPCALEDKAKITEDQKSGRYGLFCFKHCPQPRGGAENGGSKNGMDSESSVAGTSNNVNGAGSSKVYCLACEKTEGNISLESLSNSIIVSYCDKHAPSSHKRNSSVAGASDSSSSGCVTHRSSKRLTTGGYRYDMPLKRPRTDSLSCSEDDAPNKDMSVYAPIESDLSESANSAPEHQFSKNEDESLAASGAGNQQEAEEEKFIHSDAESQSLLPQEAESCTTRSAQSPALPLTVVKVEATPFDLMPRVSTDSSSFWKKCNAAGCTQAIFTDFIKMLNDISNRIQADQASQRDYGLALSVMEASGKLNEFVGKQQKELQRKQTELMKAAAAMEDVVKALRR